MMSVSEFAICESQKVGPETKVWAFSHILSGASIGAECNICESVFIENDVVIGDRVTIKNGVQVWDGLRIADDVFIGPNVTFTNDLYPRSKQHQLKVRITSIEKGASLGANATVLPGLTIGRDAMIGAGSVVTRDVPPNAIVVGNPARITGYVTNIMKSSELKTFSQPRDQLPGGASLIELTTAKDLRGTLTAIDFAADLPFDVVRWFAVHSVSSESIRGEHAHRTCHQFLVAIGGAVTVRLDDARQSSEIVLNRQGIGLHIPPMVWSSQYNFTRDAVLMVLASQTYDPDDYIREYGEFELQIDQSQNPQL